MYSQIFLFSVTLFSLQICLSKFVRVNFIPTCILIEENKKVRIVLVFTYFIYIYYFLFNLDLLTLALRILIWRLGSFHFTLCFRLFYFLLGFYYHFLVLLSNSKLCLNCVCLSDLGIHFVISLFWTAWTAACQTSLSFTINQSFLKLMSTEPMMPCNHPQFLMSPSPLAFDLSQHQGLSQWVGSSHQVAKVLELQLQHQSFPWIIRDDFF